MCFNQPRYDSVCSVLLAQLQPILVMAICSFCLTCFVGFDCLMGEVVVDDVWLRMVHASITSGGALVTRKMSLLVTNVCVCVCAHPPKIPRRV